MVVVLVHGVPETAEVWRPLIDALAGDTRSVGEVIALRLPGFGGPLPAGFEVSKASYAAWLRAELDRIAAPIDLVGHDWGALLSLKVVADGHPSVRSWVTDGGDLGPAYEWHDLAKAWQTPDVGEAMMEALVNATSDERAAIAEDAGIPAAAHRLFGDALDATMATAILGLYRSAVDVGVEWGPALDAVTVPTLVVEALADPFHESGSSARAAERLGARRVTIDAGHWWMVERPQEATDVLIEFWAEHGRGILGR